MLKFALLFLTALAFGQGDPAPYIKGQGQTGLGNQGSTIYVPNNLSTKINAYQALIEVGNSNILVNPGFEHAVASTGWTSTGVTPVESLSTVISGKKSLCFTASSQAFTLSQSSTLYAAQFADGVPGVVSVRVKSNHTGVITVCPMNAGVALSKCVTVNPTNTWGSPYKIPVILGGTSNGISISAASGTGTTCIDKAEVKEGDVKDEAVIRQTFRNIVASALVAGTTAITSGAVTSGSGLFSVGLSRITALTAISLNINLSGGVTSGNATACDVSYTSGGATLVQDLTRASSTSIYSACSTTVDMVAGEVLDLTQSGSTSSRIQITAEALTNSYSGPNSNTGWASCGHTTSDFTGFGTVTNIETQCKRDGTDLLMRGKFTSGTPTAVEARLALKLSGIALTSAPTPTIPSIQYAGPGTGSTNGAAVLNLLIEPSTAYMTFGYQASAANGLTKANGTPLAAAAMVISLNARIPITGWENSNGMTAYITEVINSPGIVKPKWCEFANAGATNATNCTAATCTEYWDSCNVVAPCTRSGTGTYTCIFANGTFSPNTYIQCGSGGPTSVPGSNAIVTDANGGYSFTIRVFSNSFAAQADGAFSGWCKGLTP